MHVEQLVLKDGVGRRNGIERNTVDPEWIQHGHMEPEHQKPISTPTQISNQRTPKEILELGFLRPGCPPIGTSELKQPHVDEDKERQGHKQPSRSKKTEIAEVSDRSQGLNNHTTTMKRQKYNTASISDRQDIFSRPVLFFDQQRDSVKEGWGDKKDASPF